MTYQNYHRHSQYSNVQITDSTVTNEDYALRAVEFGHGLISGVEHGTQGRYIEGYELAKKYNLKFLFGTEAYWVKDRLEKDNTNSHIVLLAKNENGRLAINEALSEANLTGYYYRPRIDLSLIFQLPKDDVWVTSACVAFWKYPDIDDIVLKLRDYFRKNFLLEVQYHNTEKQAELNKRIVEISNRYSIPLIMGCDSHMIHEEQFFERKNYLLSKKIEYPDEEGWYLDYPSDEVAKKRFVNQGVLTNAQIDEAMNNTNIFLEVEEYTGACFNKEIKMPSLYPEKTQEEKDKLLSDIVWNQWEIEKEKIDKSLWPKYEEEIKKELDIVFVTKHSDYFLLDREIVRLGKEKGGVITPSGRGCFTGEALVHTNHGVKPIRGVIIGDYVVDIDGNYKKVLDVLKYDIEEELVKIKYKNMLDNNANNICTKDHKILIFDGEKAKWKEASLITNKDFVCYPRSYYKDNFDNVMWDEKFIYSPILSVEKIRNTKTTVYDLTVEDSHSYLINNMVVHNSGVSFYINKLLGFTKIDRISAPVHMYPERFMSPTRILESKSLADLDLNLANPEIFAQAQKELLGENHSFPMIAYGTMRPKAAWKMYARATEIDFDTANMVSEQIEAYENDLKHAPEDEKESINILDYIDEDYKETYRESEKYLGIVASISIHPCAHLIYQGNIRSEIGLIKIKSGSKENICCVMDGKWAEDYKFLKNDLLKVAVVALIDKVFKRIEKPIPDENELTAMTRNNTGVWDVYKNATTIGVNQVEQTGTKGRVAKYAPKNSAELCAFIAAIRPGFKSMYKAFESRQKFEYGVPSFDKLIQTKEMPDSFLLYQEQSMAALNYAGIPMSECYEIIKNIAKKRPEKVLKYKEKFLSGLSERVQQEEGMTKEASDEVSNMVWEIVDNSCQYSFNASHSYCVATDSIYCAYLKSQYPLEFYEVFLDLLEKDGDKDRLAEAKIEAEHAYKIKFPPYKFGQDNRSIKAIPEKREIVSSLTSIKGFGEVIGQNLYELGQREHETFLDLLVDAEESSVLSSKFETLIKINYFDMFGNNQKLLTFFNEFTSGENRYSKKHTEKTKEKRIVALKEFWNNLPNDRLPFIRQILEEQEILGKIWSTYPNLDKRYVYVTSLDTKFAPRVEIYCMNNGATQSIKLQRKVFESHLFRPQDILYCQNFKKKNATKFVDGKYVDVEDQYNWWLTRYKVFTDKEFDEILKGIA